MEHSKPERPDERDGLLVWPAARMNPRVGEYADGAALRSPERIEIDDIRLLVEVSPWSLVRRARFLLRWRRVENQEETGFRRLFTVKSRLCLALSFSAAPRRRGEEN